MLCNYFLSALWFKVYKTNQIKTTVTNPIKKKFSVLLLKTI